jgi:hypothetical protein
MTWMEYITDKKEYIVALILPFVLFFILSPGVLFQITPDGDSNIDTTNKIAYKTAAIHSFIFTLIMSVAIYVTYMRNKIVNL